MRAFSDYRDGQVTKLAGITDGTSNTILSGEVLPDEDSNNEFWTFTGAASGTTLPINLSTKKPVRRGLRDPRLHLPVSPIRRAGSRAAPRRGQLPFADGSVHFVRTRSARRPITRWVAVPAVKCSAPTSIDRGLSGRGETDSPISPPSNPTHIGTPRRIPLRGVSALPSEARGNPRSPARMRCRFRNFTPETEAMKKAPAMMIRALRSQHLLAILTAHGPVGDIGMGDDGLPSRYSVSGKVTYKGEPVQKGRSASCRRWSRVAARRARSSTAATR